MNQSCIEKATNAVLTLMALAAYYWMWIAVLSA